MSCMIECCIDNELDARLTQLARLTGRTKTFYIKQALESQIEDMEDTYLAECVMARVTEGTETTCDLAKVERDLGLVD